MPRDIATRLRELYNAMNNPPSPGLPDGASVIIEAASAIDALKCAMIEKNRYNRMRADHKLEARAAGGKKY